MENVCHLMLSDSAASTRDVCLDLVWQQTCNQVVVSYIIISSLYLTVKLVAFLLQYCVFVVYRV